MAIRVIVTDQLPLGIFSREPGRIEYTPMPDYALREVLGCWGVCEGAFVRGYFASKPLQGIACERLAIQPHETDGRPPSSLNADDRVVYVAIDSTPNFPHYLLIEQSNTGR